MTIGNNRRPAISTVGKMVKTPTGSIIIAGWGLTWCHAHCNCHWSDKEQNIVIYTDSQGHLGLKKFRACSCCEPWTSDELKSILHNLSELEGLPLAGPELTSS